MCGIAGTFGGDRLDTSRIARTLALMSRRGPDAEGHHGVQMGDTAVNLLHSRLSILDLDPRSDQPFVRDGLALVFNGEIYNYCEIAALLREKGRHLTTGSDTEVLLEAYRCWGADCLDRLEGMWAFALLDCKAGRLLLSRDRFGEKPLFLVPTRDTVYFASEPKALAALMGRPLDVDSLHLRRYLAQGFRSLFKTDGTFFSGVREVPAATAITISVSDPTAIKESRYWTPAYAPHPMNPEEAAQGVWERLCRSMELRLRADVPLAFCLSGGVDSTSLVCTAARKHGAEIHAFSVIDQDERYNETENIAATVDLLGCRHFFAYTSTDGFFERMTDLAAYHDAPVPTISYYMHSFLSEEISRKGYKVAVSGTAADELFTGYYDHYAFWLAGRADGPEIERDLREWRSSYGRWVNNPLLQDPLLFQRQPHNRDHLFQNFELFNGYLVEPMEDGFFEETYID
ncbi:MAG: asparagine synthase (glutamine-hydrolyzing), partial [Rhodospirillales bacterium]|nr:asparagine synthase (glutamine-hydrolyzing) [Rhodospirillales bacterium]